MVRRELKCAFAENRARLSETVEALRSYLADHPDGGGLSEVMRGAVRVSSLERIRREAVDSRDGAAVVIVDYLLEFPLKSRREILGYLK